MDPLMGLLIVCDIGVHIAIVSVVWFWACKVITCLHRCNTPAPPMIMDVIPINPNEIDDPLYITCIKIGLLAVFTAGGVISGLSMWCGNKDHCLLPWMK